MVITVLSLTNVLRSEGTGVGIGIIIIGVYSLIKNIRYSTNAEYKEKVDAVQNDKHNKALSEKAWAITCYITIFAAVVGSIAFKLMGNSAVSLYIAAAVVAMVVIYFIVFVVLSVKK